MFKVSLFLSSNNNVLNLFYKEDIETCKVVVDSTVLQIKDFRFSNSVLIGRYLNFGIDLINIDELALLSKNTLDGQNSKNKQRHNI